MRQSFFLYLDTKTIQEEMETNGFIRWLILSENVGLISFSHLQTGIRAGGYKWIHILSIAVMLNLHYRLISCSYC